MREIDNAGNNVHLTDPGADPVCRLRVEITRYDVEPLITRHFSYVDRDIHAHCLHPSLMKGDEQNPVITAKLDDFCGMECFNHPHRIGFEMIDQRLNSA